MSKHPLFLLLLSIISFSSSAQQGKATVSGFVTDQNGSPVSGASIVLLGKTKGIATNDSGYFTLSLPAQKPLALVFSHTGFISLQRNFFLANGEIEKITVMLKRDDAAMQTVIVSSNTQRNETGLIQIDPKNALTLP